MLAAAIEYVILPTLSFGIERDRDRDRRGVRFWAVSMQAAEMLTSES